MKQFKFLHILAVVIVTAFIFTACTQVDEALPVDNTAVTEPEIQPYPTTVGSLVFNSAPENVATLSPAMTEIVAELGFGDKLIGRSNYCSYPESVTALDTLGSAANPDIEAIIEKAPQLLISQSPIAKKDITAIEAVGTRVLIISAPTSVDELYDLYDSIYRVFNGEDGNMEATVSEKFAPLEKSFEDNGNILGSYAFILSAELAVASDSTFAGDFFSHMGENVVGEITGNSVTSEELLDLDPDCIILSADITEEDLPEELGELSAIENGKVIILDSETAELLERPTSRIYLAAEYIAESVENFDNESNTEDENSDEESEE